LVGYSTYQFVNMIKIKQEKISIGGLHHWTGYLT